MEWVDAEETMDQKFRDAIRYKLLFRREFLGALDEDHEVIDTRSTESFVSCLSALQNLTDTVELGTPVPEAFSLKIQRRLASTVPPRPIVHISTDDALAHVKRLCQDAIDMQHILEYRGPSNFKVDSSFLFISQIHLLRLFLLTIFIFRLRSGHSCPETPNHLFTFAVFFKPWLWVTWPSWARSQ